MKTTSTVYLCVFWMLLYLVIMLSQDIDCYTIGDSTSLLQHITANYSKNFRPLYNQSETLRVYLSFDLVSIIEIDEVQERITVTGIVYTFWNDSFMTWDPANYGGLETLTLKRETIWTPEIIHVNAAKEVTRLTQDWHDLRVTSTGLVSYIFGEVFTSVCSFNIRYFPMDRQTCNIQLYSLGFINTELLYVLSSTKIQTNYLTDNGAWDLVDSNAVLIKDQNTPSFQMVLNRKPGFVVLNIVCPIIFMSMLNILIFFIPTDSGERISYSITVLLAIAVLLTVVSDTLPKTSNPMSLYSYYLLSILVLSMCITICTIFSLRLYHKTVGDSIGPWWKGIVRVVEKGTLCKASNRTSVEDVRHTADTKVDEANGCVDGRSSNRTVERDNTHTYDDWITWQLVSIVLDKMLFVFYLSVLVVDTIVFMVLITSGN